MNMNIESRLTRNRGGDFCSAVNCLNTRRKKSCKGKSFFRFPKDEERCKKWVQLCRREFPKHVSPLDLHKSYRICCDHFDDSQFECANRKSLVWNALPTLFDVLNPPPKAGLSGIENQETWVTMLMDRKVYTLWRQIKDDSFLSDTDLASFLLNYYDQNREAPSSCTRCSCPLSHLCTGQENVDMTVKKPKQEHEEEVKEEDIDKPGLTPSCELSPGQHGGVTPDNLSAVDTFIKLEPQSDQATEYVERAVKTQEEILKETVSDDQIGSKNWTTIELSGNVYRKWREVKVGLLLKDYNQLATFLIRIFKEEARPGCVKCASPLWHLCAACLQRSVEGGHGENDNKSTLISLVEHGPVSACSKPEPCLAENTEWEQSSVKQLDNFACRDNQFVSMSHLANCPNNMEG